MGSDSVFARWLLLPLVMGCAFGLSVFQIHNDDAGFHVANGAWILAESAVPEHNPFSFVEDGAKWTQHQWLSATWMAWVVDQWGVHGLILWKALMVSLCFGVLAWGTRSLPLGWRLAVLSMALAGSAYRFVERPYLFTMVFMAVAGVGLVEARKGRRGGLWIAGLASVVALHFHAGGLYLLLFWGTFAVEALVQAAMKANPPGLSVRERLGWAIAVCGLALGSVVAFAPSGLDVLLLPLHFSHHAYWNAHLGEFRPLPLHGAAYAQWLAIGCVLLAGVHAVRTREVFPALILFGFGFLAVKHARMIFPLCVAATAVAGAFVVTEKAAGKRALLVVLLGVMTLGMASVDQMERYRMGLGEDGWDRTRHPVELMDRAAEMPGETFVSDGLAGTWLWRNFRGSETSRLEQRRVLIHNCLECYREETYKDVYQWIRYGKEGWAEKVRTLGIRSFLLKHTTPGEREMQEGAPNIRQHLYQSNDWILVDFDDVASLYVLWSELPEGGILLETAERPFPVDPDSWRPRHDDTPWEPIRKALLDHSATHLGSIRSLMIVGQLAFQARDLETLAHAAKEVALRRPDSSQAESLLGLLEGLAAR